MNALALIWAIAVGQGPELAPEAPPPASQEDVQALQQEVATLKESLAITEARAGQAAQASQQVAQQLGEERARADQLEVDRLSRVAGFTRLLEVLAPANDRLVAGDSAALASITTVQNGLSQLAGEAQGEGAAAEADQSAAAWAALDEVRGWVDQRDFMRARFALDAAARRLVRARALAEQRF